MKLCYTDTDSFIFYTKTKDFYEDINNNVEKWFDNELGGRIMTKFVSLCSKTYAYLIDDFEEKKRNKGVKKCVVINELKFSY